MNIITLKNPSIMGEHHPVYGYTFWSETDADLPVMFNHKEGNIMPGTRVTYESAEAKTSKNGKDYMRLKKVSLEDSPEPHKQPFTEKPAPTFKKAQIEEDNKGRGITAAMAYKLAYHAFIQTESILPDSDAAWDVIKDQAQHIFDDINQISSASISGVGDTQLKEPVSHPTKAAAETMEVRIDSSIKDKLGEGWSEPDETDD